MFRKYNLTFSITLIAKHLAFIIQAISVNRTSSNKTANEQTKHNEQVQAEIEEKKPRNVPSV